MENKKLFELELTKKIEGVGVSDEALELVLDDTRLKFESYHDQSSYEHVYADFSVMKYYVEALKDKMLHLVEIKGVEGMGFLLCFEFHNADPVKVFIPCYNHQNGYYSDSLQIKISRYNEVSLVDVSECVEDDLSL